MKILKDRDHSHTLMVKTGIDYDAFKKWVEDTKLFAVIKHHTQNGGFLPEIRSAKISLSLKAGVVVNKMEDLPQELILEFFLNSPFYHERDTNTNRLERDDNI